MSNESVLNFIPTIWSITFCKKCRVWFTCDWLTWLWTKYKFWEKPKQRKKERIIFLFIHNFPNPLKSIKDKICYLLLNCPNPSFLEYTKPCYYCCEMTSSKTVLLNCRRVYLLMCTFVQQNINSWLLPVLVLTCRNKCSSQNLCII